MVRALILDLDDTLYPEHDYVVSGFTAVAERLAQRHRMTAAPLIAARMQELLDEHGRGSVFDHVLRELGLPPALVRVLVHDYRSHRPRIELYADVVPALTSIRSAGLAIAVVTNGHGLMQDRKVEALGLREYVDEVVICDVLGADAWKPCADAMEVALTAVGAEPTRSWVVGDDPCNDIVPGRSIGLRPVLLERYGVRRAAPADMTCLERPCPVARDLLEVADHVSLGTSLPMTQ